MNCAALIAEFETKREKRNKKPDDEGSVSSRGSKQRKKAPKIEDSESEASSRSAVRQKTVKLRDSKTAKSGFELGLTPKAVKGAMLHHNRLVYLIEWEDDDEFEDLASAEDVHKHW